MISMLLTWALCTAAVGAFVVRVGHHYGYLKHIRTPVELIETGSRKWVMNTRDWFVVHWATIWAGLGAMISWMANEIQMSVVPMVRNLGATWNFFGLNGIAAAVILGGLAAFLIQLCQSHPPDQMPPGAGPPPQPPGGAA